MQMLTCLFTQDGVGGVEACYLCEEIVFAGLVNLCYYVIDMPMFCVRNDSI